jgi:hypothetical protein
MNPEHNDKVSSKPINEVELEDATNSTFNAWTQGARDLYKGFCKKVEDCDDHATMILTDIFGTNVAREHSRRLQEEARREADAGHTNAANHFKRRDLNFSRSTLGEFDGYTVNLNEGLKTEPAAYSLTKLEQSMAAQPTEKLQLLLAPLKFGSN